MYICTILVEVMTEIVKETLIETTETVCLTGTRISYVVQTRFLNETFSFLAKTIIMAVMLVREVLGMDFSSLRMELLLSIL